MRKDTGTAFLTYGADGTVDNMKKGGKVEMSNKQIVNVKVNVGDLPKKKAPKPRKARKPKPVGDTVLLREGNVPARKRPGLHVRFLSPGSAFGGGLPAPLNSASYASAPPVAQPLGRMDFIGSGEVPYSRGRDRRDDIPINVNPSGIRADLKPSMRAVSSSSAVASPDTGLELSRLRGSYDALSPEYQRIYNNLAFQGEVPRLNDPNLQPSMRASASRPTAGQLASSSSSSYREGDGGSEELLRYKSDEYVPPPMSLAGASSASAMPSSASAMNSSASRNQPGRERPFTTTLSVRRPQAERENYPTTFLHGQPKQKRDPPVDYQQLRRGGSVF
jgi:hypothetical protein